MTLQKKIGILTLHRANNYGAMFQAYALKTVLKQQGHDPFIVDYQRELASVKKYLKSPISFFSKIIEKGAISPKFAMAKLLEKKGHNRESQFIEIFEDFRRVHLPISQKPYSYADLVSNGPVADAFIVGSDQVWADDFVFSSPAFLLGFASEHAKRISYAASFGKKNLERYLRSSFIEHLSKFDAVAVREKSGCELVKQLTGRNATHVVDPTLLMTDYSEIVDYSLVPEHDYIFTYRLRQDDKLTHWMDESLAEICSHKDLPLYSVTTNAAPGSVKLGEDLRPTPGQLLGLIEKANLFVTNSFHGTVFAMLLKTNFLTFARDAEIDKQNLRLTELLNSVGLEECYCPPGLEASNVIAKIQTSRDFEQVFKVLDGPRETSLSYLNQALV